MGLPPDHAHLPLLQDEAVVAPDTLTRGERAAWIAQRTFRRWSVFILINVIAFAWLAFGNDTARTWWNFAWSALAVDVEFITALALVSLAMRDHERLERIERIEQHIEEILEHLKQ